MIGIYKITNPKNKVYIGQSIDIEKRFRTYKSLNKNVEPQVKLYRSLLKYGVENHFFEIVCECDVNDLNEKERYYQELYNVIDNGLNCLMTNTEAKKKILCKEMANKNKVRGKDHGMYGKTHTEEAKKKISDTHKGRKYNEERLAIHRSCLKRGKEHHNYGKTMSLEQKEKLLNANMGKTQSEITIQKRAEKVRKIILDINTGIFYFGAKEASQAKNININVLWSKLKGFKQNNTGLIYV